MSKTIYIAGPMRGYKYYNFPAFDKWQEYFESQGYEVINPAELDRMHGFDPYCLPEDYDWNQIPDETGFSFTECVKRDAEAVLESDVLFLLDGWEDSKGANAEKALAEWAGREIWYEDDFSACNGEVWYTEGDNELHEVDNTESENTKPTNPKDEIGTKKAKVSTVPAGVVMKIGLAMLEGAVKYGRHNYRAVGVRSSIYYDACAGHLFDWWEGQDIDPDSELHHLDKALASLVVLRDAMLQDKLTDDRPPCSQIFKQDMNEDAKVLIEKHSDKNPKHYTIED